MQNETQNLIEQVLASVSQHGAEGDVLITEEAQLGLKCHQGELSEYKVTSSRTVGVRVICGDQVGTYSESTETADLQNMVELRWQMQNIRSRVQRKITSGPQDILDWSDEIYRPDSTPKRIRLSSPLARGWLQRETSASAPYNGFGEAECPLLSATPTDIAAFTKKVLKVTTTHCCREMTSNPCIWAIRSGELLTNSQLMRIAELTTPLLTFLMVPWLKQVGTMSFSHRKRSANFSVHSACAGLGCQR